MGEHVDPTQQMMYVNKKHSVFIQIHALISWHLRSRKRSLKSFVQMPPLPVPVSKPSDELYSSITSLGERTTMSCRPTHPFMSTPVRPLHDQRQVSNAENLNNDGRLAVLIRAYLFSIYTQVVSDWLKSLRRITSASRLRQSKTLGWMSITRFCGRNGTKHRNIPAPLVKIKNFVE